jgi:phosphoglycolate phosphatase
LLGALLRPTVTDQQAQSEYDALVYDLDGTLVRLDVDWGAVTEEVAAVLRARGLETEG